MYKKNNGAGASFGDPCPVSVKAGGPSNGQWSRSGAPEKIGHSSRALSQTVIAKSSLGL